jgi:hypothetical protein
MRNCSLAVEEVRGEQWRDQYYLLPTLELACSSHEGDQGDKSGKCEGDQEEHSSKVRGGGSSTGGELVMSR